MIFHLIHYKERKQQLTGSTNRTITMDQSNEDSLLGRLLHFNYWGSRNEPGMYLLYVLPHKTLDELIGLEGHYVFLIFFQP
ncbi:unnamed protein product [Onchocerca flexuosa]|uniref:Ovule protein n=1 Tax=Onchocerca flexuosa TaxID=387005 RepID=A0A183HSH4_9BILA|nr:unnamed protein product [Onchocerca flexuosa]